MKMIRFFTSFSVAVVLSVGATPAAADVLSAYFSKDSTRDIFGTPISLKEADPIVLQLPKKEKKQEEAKEEAKVVEPAKDEIKLEEGKEVEELPLEERLAEKYGDPKEKFPVSAIESAPAPFKAMIEALQEGDQQLAFKYGLQYTRYKQDLVDINQKAVSMIGQSLVREGVLGENSWASSPEYSEDVYLRNLDLDKPGEEPNKNQEKGLIHDQANLVLARAKEVAFKDFSEAILPSDAIALELDEEEERKIARQKLKGKVPVDPEGKVDVYFFFEPRDKELWGYAKDIEYLNKELEKDPRANLMAFTTRRYNSNDIYWFKRGSKAEFPIQSGEAVAKAMQVKSTPTIIFVSRNTSRFHVEEGMRNFYYLDEARKIMQGDA